MQRPERASEPKQRHDDQHRGGGARRHQPGQRRGDRAKQGGGGDTDGQALFHAVAVRIARRV